MKAFYIIGWVEVLLELSSDEMFQYFGEKWEAWDGSEIVGVLEDCNTLMIADLITRK